MGMFRCLSVGKKFFDIIGKRGGGGNQAAMPDGHGRLFEVVCFGELSEAVGLSLACFFEAGPFVFWGAWNNLLIISVLESRRSSGDIPLLVIDDWRCFEWWFWGVVRGWESVAFNWTVVELRLL